MVDRSVEMEPEVEKRESRALSGTMRRVGKSSVVRARPTCELWMPVELRGGGQLDREAQRRIGLFPSGMETPTHQ